VRTARPWRVHGYIFRHRQTQEGHEQGGALDPEKDSATVCCSCYLRGICRLCQHPVGIAEPTFNKLAVFKTKKKQKVTC